MSKKDTQEDEGIIDAKANETTAVATVDTNTQVSTQVTVQGVSLRFPFMRVGQMLSQWRVSGKKPEEGAFYLGKDKSNNVMIAGAGRENGITAILLDVVNGIMEDKPFTGAANPPKRWVGPDAEKEAAKEGITLTPQATDKVWPDTGRPIMRANGAPFCYLQMLVPVPEDALETMMDYQMFPIGDKLYTPARIEFSKQAYRMLADVTGNIERMETFRNRKNADFKFTWSGKIIRLFTETAISKQTGAEYPILKFSLAVEGGKAVEFTEDEKKDFLMFLASIKETVASVNDTEASDF